VDTITLKDTLLTIREQVEGTGASKVTYEASVVTTAEGSLSLAVVPASSTIGASGKREVGSKVIVEIDLTQKVQEKPSRARYLLDLKSLKATLQPKPASTP